MRNLNQTTYGDLEQYGKTGWGNSNGLQVQMERRYARALGHGAKALSGLATARRFG